jgi:diguanylate cyclase (GGDEF)-like protein/PAS domain S-box-containing protein
MLFRKELSANLAFLTVMVLTILATGLASFYLIARIKASAIEESCKRSSLHAQAFADHVNNSLNLVVNLADFFSTLPPEVTMAGAEGLFRKTVHLAPFLHSVSLLEANGRVSASSHPNNVGLQVDTEGYLQYSLAGEHRLEIGLPLAGRNLDEARQANSGNPSADWPVHSLPVVQRFLRNGAEISLLTVLNLDAFAEHFSGRLSAEEGFVELFRNDQLLLLSSAGPAKRGVGAGHGGGFSLALAAETVRFEEAQLDQGTYFSAVRPTGQHPLVVAVRLDRYTALAAWRDERRRLLLVIVPALAGVVLLATALYRYQQRAVIEREEAKQQEHDRLATSVFDTVAEAVMVTGPDQLILAVNPAFTRITGYGGGEVIGESATLLAAEAQTAEFYQQLSETLANEGHWAGEVHNRRKSGELFVAWLSVNQVRNKAGEVTHHVTVFSDFTEHRSEVERIEYLAHHDMLTGLPNRTLFYDRLRQAIGLASRERRRLGLIFIDLDRFKPVNDLFGHTQGDLLLKKVAERMLQQVRASDTVVRLGGDEFVVLLPNLDTEEDALAVAEKLRRALYRPFQLGEHVVQISSSSGIALYPEDGSNEAELLRCADEAMYQAKKSGGNRLRHKPPNRAGNRSSQLSIH